MKAKISLVVALCAVFTMPVAAHAEDFSTAIFDGVSDLRPACGPLGDDPRLEAAAQRHADDLVIKGVENAHVGSDGSSPRARILDAGYLRPGKTGEIVFWGTGSHANPNTALDMWMQSPPHRTVIEDCSLTAAGFAVAWSGNMMIAVGDFARP